MKKITVLLTVCVSVLLVLSACGPVEAIPAPVATSTDSGGPTAGQSIVTLEDQGKTISLHVGEGFLLKLGEGYDWGIEISDQNVLSRVKNMAVIRGAQGIYQGLQPGTVSVKATGDPECRKSQPACGMPSILVEFTVIVK